MTVSADSTQITADTTQYTADNYYGGGGVSPGLVPGLTGSTLLPAMVLLTAVELNVGTVSYIQSDAYAVNEVVAQSVAPGTQLPLYSTVNLTVCSGPPYVNQFSQAVTVPNVVG